MQRRKQDEILFGFIKTAEKQSIPLTLQRFGISALLNWISFFEALLVRSSAQILLNFSSNLRESSVLKTQSPFIVQNISLYSTLLYRQNIYAFFLQENAQNYTENIIFICQITSSENHTFDFTSVINDEIIMSFDFH